MSNYLSRSIMIAFIKRVLAIITPKDVKVLTTFIKEKVEDEKQALNIYRDLTAIQQILLSTIIFVSLFVDTKKKNYLYNNSSPDRYLQLAMEDVTGSLDLTNEALTKICPASCADTQDETVKGKIAQAYKYFKTKVLSLAVNMRSESKNNVVTSANDFVLTYLTMVSNLLSTTTKKYPDDTTFREYVYGEDTIRKDLDKLLSTLSVGQSIPAAPVSTQNTETDSTDTQDDVNENQGDEAPASTEENTVDENTSTETEVVTDAQNKVDENTSTEEESMDENSGDEAPASTEGSDPEGNEE